MALHRTRLGLKQQVERQGHGAQPVVAQRFRLRDALCAFVFCRDFDFWFRWC